MRTTLHHYPLFFLLAFMLMPRVGQSQVARFALVAGSNEGREAKKTLRYAERDARRFAAVLISLGGFPKGDVRVLKGPTSEQMLGAIDAMNQKMSRVGKQVHKTLAVIYFSGHADGMHLELGDERLPFDTLTAKLEQLDADIKILVVDSCQSGGVTAFKGGRPGPAYDLVFTENIDANGTAILTSSAAGEKSQESGRLEGSFFTHFLVSGLQGTADFDQDQRITLNELYQYTYSKTVAETSRTIGGTQHPTYDFRMTGRGKVVLTDLTRGETQLQFGPEMAGTFLILREETEEIVAEVSKPQGTWRTIALPSDTYLVATRKADAVYSKAVTIERGRRLRIESAALKPEPMLTGVFEKGDALNKRSNLGLALHYGLLTGALKQYAVLHQGILGLRWDVGPLTLFPRVSVGTTRVDDGALKYRMLLFSGDLHAAWRFERSAFDIFAGIGVGGGFGRQRLDGGDERNGSFLTYTGLGGIVLPIAAAIELSLFWEAGGHLFRAEQRLSSHVILRAAVGVGYRF